MSDNENRSVEVIKEDAQILLPISGSFYGRLTKLLISIATTMELKDYGKTVSKFKEDFFFEPETEQEANIQTLLALVASCEALFLEDKKNFDLREITDKDLDELKKYNESNS
jgi:hypothetical protein